MADFYIYDSAGHGFNMPYTDAVAADFLPASTTGVTKTDDNGSSAALYTVQDGNATKDEVLILYTVDAATGTVKIGHAGTFVDGTLTAEINGMALAATPAEIANNGVWFKTINGGNDVFYGNKYDDQLSGGAGDDIAFGNAGNDVLYGDSGIDVLDGGPGNDFLDGGSGLDGAIWQGNSWEYTFKSNADSSVTVTDKLGRYGSDTLVNIEALGFDDGNFDFGHLVGPYAPPPPPPAGAPPPPAPAVTFNGTNGNDVLVGNALNNKMYGYAGNDTLKGGSGHDFLYGGKGVDKLYGGAGKDSFVFNTAPTSGRDAINDFRVVDDTIRLDNAFFTKVGSNGGLKSYAFHTSKTGKAHDANDRIIYDNDSGLLYYDADGTGAKAGVCLASISKGLKITASDFYIV